MASSHLVLVLEAVAELDRKLAAVALQSDVLAASLGTDLTAGLRGSFHQVQTSMRSLRAHVVDSAAALTAEWHESALRARTALVLVQLAELKASEHEVAREERLHAGRFQGLRDVDTFLLDRIGRVNATWVKQRRAVNAWTGSVDAVARHAHHTAVLNTAEHAFAVIGDDVDLVSFLHAGAAVRSDRFRTACWVLAMLLGITIERNETMSRTMGGG